MKFLPIFLVIFLSIGTANASIFDDVSNWFGNAGKSIKSWADGVKKGVEETWDYLKTTANQFWESVTNFWDTYISKYTSELKRAMKSVEEALTWVWDRIRNGLTEKDLITLKNVIMNAIKSVLQYAEDKFKEMMNIIETELDHQINETRSHANEIRNIVKFSKHAKLKEKCDKKYHNVLQKFENKVVETLKNCSQQFTDSIWGIYKFIKEIILDIPDILTEIRDSAMSCYNNISWDNFTCIFTFVANLLSTVGGLIGDVLSFKGLLIRALKKAGKAGICATTIIAKTKIAKSCFTDKINWCLTPKKDKTDAMIEYAHKVTYERNCLEEFDNGLISGLVSVGQKLIS